MLYSIRPTTELTGEQRQTGNFSERYP